jgi:hypothetical protein
MCGYRGTHEDKLYLGLMGRVLSLCQMSRHLHGQPQQARANPLARCICLGCWGWEILQHRFQQTGLRHSQRYHLKSGAHLLVIRDVGTDGEYFKGYPLPITQVPEFTPEY